ncbi:MAG: methyltransferase domain-containing protein [Roseobacter sp.]
MSKLAFTKKRARTLVDFYSTRDVVAQRAATMEKLAIRPGEAIIDIGSGPGFLSEDLAAATGPKGSVLGVDISDDLISFCRARNRPEWLSYELADATALPTQANHFDVATCTQVVEYVPDAAQVLREIFRVLKPKGRAIIVATDWDTVAWHSEHPDRMAQVMQAWEAHCAHPRLPRTLAPKLRAAGFKITGISMYPLVNDSFERDAYSHGIAQLVHAYTVDGGHIPKSQGDAWMEELASLHAAGQYYFASGRMLFTVVKPG